MLPWLATSMCRPILVDHVQCSLETFGPTHGCCDGPSEGSQGCLRCDTLLKQEAGRGSQQHVVTYEWPVPLMQTDDARQVTSQAAASTCYLYDHIAVNNGGLSDASAELRYCVEESIWVIV